jgi:GNAT superfamily N-acetyltransferase
MPSTVTFRPAVVYSLEQLAELYTRMFAGYTYPISVSADWLAARLVPEDIDLAASPVICVDQQPVGLAVYARRGRAVNCAGFGIVAEQRGRGLARQLLAAFVAQARAEHALEISLMVLAENEAALKTYLRAGFTTTRMLDWFAGRLPPAAPDRYQPGADAAPAALLHAARSAGLHGALPFWQNADATLERLPDLTGWSLLCDGRLQAVALTQPQAGGLHLQRLLAADDAAARAVLARIAAQQPQLSVNEPGDSPWHQLFADLGLALCYRRCDLQLLL